MYPKRMRLGGHQMNFCPPPPPPEPTLVRCGDIWEGYEGHFVRLRGRVVKSRLGRFIELRDGRGVAQLVADEEKPKILRMFQTLPIDSYITAFGVVKPRLKPNVSIPTGRVEVLVDEIRDIDYPRIEGPSGNLMQYRSFSTTTQTPPAKSRKITSVEYKKINGVANLIDRLSNRETTCGELRISDVGRKVTLVGWIEQKKHGKFLHLRDGYGNTQIVIDHENPHVRAIVAHLTPETFIKAVGYVVERPSSNRNMSFETGDIEVICEEFNVVDPTVPYDGPILQKTPETVVEPMVVEEPTPPERVSPKANKFTTRTHTCGELTETDIGKDVILCGWLEFERMKKFFTLRDGYGVTQVVVPEDLERTVRIENIPFESILEVTGVVLARPPGMRNESLATGTIEIMLKSLKILNPAKRNLPFNLRDHCRAKESLRMEYRYMDLRYSDMQKNLRTRSRVLMKMRDYLCNHAGFVEVETPTLFRKSPGGAQEFVVPTRRAGYFYSLVQSPQQFKQMLMVGAIDRYFQIARCYRDENTRPDRQPEFTQLDIELSFTTKEKIMELVENVLAHCWPEFCGGITMPFPQITYTEAMEKYGTDKPDIRFEMFLKNITDIAKNSTEITKTEDFGAYTLIIKTPNSQCPKAIKDTLQKIGSQAEGAKFYNVRIGDVPAETVGLIKIFGEDVAKQLVEDCNLEKDDLFLFALGEKEAAQLCMGRVRLAMRENMEKRGIYTPLTGFRFCWIIDFPLFCKSERPDALDSVHHPFTGIHTDDMTKFVARKDVLNIRSLAYDLVLNGQEIGGGSIRIHEPMQQRNVIVDYLKLRLGDFTHMIEALQTGCPPHGGIALGLDRLLALMCNAESIRDVIAFPKGMEGKDPLSKAPALLTQEDKELYCLEIVQKPAKSQTETAAEVSGEKQSVEVRDEDEKMATN